MTNSFIVYVNDRHAGRVWFGAVLGWEGEGGGHLLLANTKEAVAHLIVKQFVHDHPLHSKEEAGHEPRVRIMEEDS